MKTKEKIIRESIQRLTAEHNNLMELWNATPLSDIIQLRKELSDKLKSGCFDPSKNQEDMKWLKQSIEKEKELFALAEKQQKETLSMPGMRAKIELELADLNHELYFLTERQTA